MCKYVLDNLLDKAYSFMKEADTVKTDNKLSKFEVFQML